MLIYLLHVVAIALLGLFVDESNRRGSLMAMVVYVGIMMLAGWLNDWPVILVSHALLIVATVYFMLARSSLVFLRRKGSQLINVPVVFYFLLNSQGAVSLLAKWAP